MSYVIGVITFIIDNIFLQMTFLTWLAFILCKLVAKTIFWIISLLLWMIYRPITVFAIYKILFILKRCLRKNWRYVVKFVIILALIFKFALLILAIDKVKLVIFVFIDIILLHKFVYNFIVDNRNIQIIDKAKSVRCKIGEIGGKSKVTFIYLDNIIT